MMNLVTVLFLQHSFAAAPAGETRTVSNGFCTALIENQHCLRDRTNVDVSVIDEDKAADLFRSFKSNVDYAWGYRPNGCFARATKMAREAETQGITFAKVYAEGRLRVLPPGPLAPAEQRWQWHVAPVVYVKSVRDGKEAVELKVIDPAIFNHPVSVNEWKEQLRSADDMNRELSNVRQVLRVSNAENKLSYSKPLTADYSKFMKPEVQELYFGSRYQYMNRRGDQDDVTAWQPNDLRAADQTLKAYRLYELKVANKFGPQPGDAPPSPYLILGTKGAR